MTNVYTPRVMRRLIRSGVVLLTALAMGLSLAPALVASGDCMPRAGCPMMGGSAKSGHCQPTDSFVADCCSMQSPPADTGQNSRVVVVTSAELQPAATAAGRPSVDEPTTAVMTCSPLAGKLHTIGRHTLFQSFLS